MKSKRRSIKDERRKIQEIEHTNFLACGKIKVLVVDAKMAAERVDVPLASVNPD